MKPEATDIGMYDGHHVMAVTDSMGAQVILKSPEGNKLSQDFITHGEAIRQAKLLVDGLPNSIKWHETPKTISEFFMALAVRPRIFNQPLD